MVDYDKLSIEFTRELHSYDRERLIRWIEQDRRRLFFERLSIGEIMVDGYGTEEP